MTLETHNTNPVEKTKPRHWFRFRLRTLLIMVTLLSVLLGWVGWELDQRRKEKATIDWVEEMDGEVGFSSYYENDERTWWEKTKDKWFGEMRVQYVWFFATKNDLSPLAELKNLKVLVLNNTKVSDLSPLAELKNLTTLLLYATEVSDLSPLAELKKLKYLDLSNTQVCDLSPLSELKNLEYLVLNNTKVSDEQVQELRLALPNCDIEFNGLFDDLRIQQH